MHSIFRILDESTDSAGPDLISLADLKAVLGITGSDEDEALQASITFQSRIIAEYCDRRFGRAEAIETFTFDALETSLARQALVLKLYPVSEIISVDGGASEYTFDPESGRVWGGPWSGTVAVTYSGGYDLPEEAPARLSRAVIDAVNESRQSGTRDPTIQSVAHGDTRVSYFSSSTSSGSSGYLSAAVTDLIRSYRRMSVA
jgi:hypothetical protein